MFSRVFSEDNSVTSGYRTADLSESRESSSESSFFLDSEITQRASSVYRRYRECIADPAEDGLDIKVPRIWTSETGELLKNRPSDASSSSDEESEDNLSSSNRSSLSSLTDKHGDFENIDVDCEREDPLFSGQEWLESDNHHNLLKSLDEEELSDCTSKEVSNTPTTEPLTPETTSRQTSPARFSPVNTAKRTFVSLFRPKPI